MKRFISLFCVLSMIMTGCSATGQGEAPTSAETSSGVSSDTPDLTANKTEGEIVVSCYDTMQYKNFLEEAALKFEEKNPGTKINIETLGEMPQIQSQDLGDGKKMQMIQQGDDSQAKTDYVNKINTELISGSGPDLIAMDIVPYYKYINNGSLENLSEYIEADESFNIADYRQNILDALKFNGSNYVLPIDYSFDYLAYDSSLFNDEALAKLESNDQFTYDQLLETVSSSFNEVNENAEKPTKVFGIPVSSKNGPSLFSGMLDHNYNKFLDLENKRASFNDGSFVEMLEKLKSYADQNYVEASAQGGMLTMDSFEKVDEERFFYKTKASFQLLLSYMKGLNLQIRIGSAGMGNEDDDVIAGMLTGDNGENIFSYKQAYGINSNSENKQLAWEFLKFMLSEEMQASMQLGSDSLPVNNTARMEKAKSGVTGELFMRMGNQADPQNPMPESNSGELTAEQQDIYDKYTKTVEKLSDKLNSYVIRDEIIDNIINSEIESFFSGSKSAEEAASVIQNKVDLYLNE